MSLTGRRTTSPNWWLLSGIRWASFFFLLGGLVAAGYAGYVVADARAYEAIQLHKFAPAVLTVEPRWPQIGEPLGEIEISRLALKAVILQGDSSQVLRRGIGHLPGTPMPGEKGNVGLAGHRDSFFRPLRQIRTGDIIALRTSRGEFQYRVVFTRVVAPSDIEVLANGDRRELTLVTCFPFNYVGPSPNRFIVRALQISADR